MSMPDGGMSVTDGSSAVILLELGKQSKDLAVISTKLDSVLTAQNDHENRLRAVESQVQQARGGRDMQARVVSWLAAAVGAGAGIAGYLHR